MNRSHGAKAQAGVAATAVHHRNNRVEDEDALSAAKMVTSHETVPKLAAEAVAAMPAISAVRQAISQESVQRLLSAAETEAASNAAAKDIWHVTALMRKAAKEANDVAVVVAVAAEPATNVTKKVTWQETVRKQAETTTEALAVRTNDPDAMTTALVEAASIPVQTSKIMAGVHPRTTTTQDGEITPN